MQLTIAAMGTRLEQWIYDAFEGYRKRLPRQLKLKFQEVPLARRSAGTDSTAAVGIEGERLLRSVSPDAYALILDERGHQWSSIELAAQLKHWQEQDRDVAILIGGPDGLAEACRRRADRVWSLSRLTLPHGLVRVVLVEQLYRACSILQGHPYHRA